MRIDTTTLADLEIFRSLDGSAGVIHLIDRTSTSRGRAALRRRLGQPSSEIAVIRATQEAVRVFQSHLELVRFDDRAVRSVDRYLGSNIVIASSTGERIEMAWMWLRYRDVLEELRVGVRETRSLFRSVRLMSSSIAKHDPPEIVSGILEELGEIANLVLSSSGAAGPLNLDRRFRRSLKDQIRTGLDLLGELDALTSMASAANSLAWTFPELIDSPDFLLEAEGVFHPFVENPVPNPARWSGGEPLVFLTGPNMAGKTTYLRAVAILVHLTQTGMPVPAASARLTPVEALFTSLNPSDNLKAGVSFFVAEVMRVKAAASLLAEGRRALVLFDEVFKGTNVKDALEASAEVITGFAKARRSGLIFSSHLSELVEVLRHDPAIRFCCFDGEIVKGSPSYSYELREGVSDKRFGLLLLREAGIPELIARISA